jgi:hypothetical protein
MTNVQSDQAPAKRGKMLKIHREFVPPNTMVNSDFYCDVLRRLRENMRRKKTKTLAQQQLAPSSRQRARPHVPEDHSL